MPPSTLTPLYAPPQHVTDPDACVWYHVMDLPGGLTTPGVWDLRGRFADYTSHVPMQGRRVLDVGCASGFLSFAAEAAGAREVVSFDMDDATRQHLLPFPQRPYTQDYAQWVKDQTAYIHRWHQGYWLAHRLLQSQARVCYGDVYALPDALGTFDVTLVGAVLEHLRDPLHALTALAARTHGTLVISSEVLPTEEPLARFVGHPDRPETDYVFWVYSVGTYRAILGILGFDLVRVTTADYHYTALGGAFPRTALVAQRR